MIKFLRNLNHEGKLPLFQLFLFLFILLSVPIIAYFFRGYVFFVPLTILGYLMLLVIRHGENVFKRYSKVKKVNSVFHFFFLLYIIGVLANQILYIGLFENLNLLINRYSVIIGIFVCFGYFSYNSSTRLFQILYIVFNGIQALYSLPFLINDPEFVRNSYQDNFGAWAHGDPSYFTMQIVFIPILFWRSFSEKGILRFLLIILCIAIIGMCTVSSFGTPVGLVIAGFVIISVLAFFIKGNWKSKFLASFLFIFLFSFYQVVKNHPLLTQAQNRIENAYEDPTSGGYQGEEAKEGSRWLLSLTSYDLFLANPFFGGGGGSSVSNSKLGGHSSFFDMLGAFGLFGGAGGFIVLIIICLKNVMKKYIFTRDWESLVGLTTMILYTIAGIVNPYWEGFYFVLLLIICKPIFWPKTVIQN